MDNSQKVSAMKIAGLSVKQHTSFSYFCELDGVLVLQTIVGDYHCGHQKRDGVDICLITLHGQEISVIQMNDTVNIEESLRIISEDLETKILSVLEKSDKDDESELVFKSHPRIDGIWNVFHDGSMKYTITLHEQSNQWIAIDCIIGKAIRTRDAQTTNFATMQKFVRKYHLNKMFGKW